MTAGEKSAIRCLVAFSTADVEEGRRLDYYHDASRSIYPGVEADLPRDGEFNASFKAYALKEAVLTGISAPGHSFKRGERGPRKWADDTVSLNICAFSNLRAEYAGIEWQLHPGTPFFIDNSLPFFRIDADHRRRMIHSSLIFDRKLLNLEKSRLSPRDINVAIGRTHAGRQLALQMRLMCEASRAGKLELADLMSAPVFALLRSVAEEAAGHREPERLSLEVIKRVALCHIADPDFEIHHLARIFHCTARTVQSRFAEAGETFSSWLLTERLESGAPKTSDARVFRPHRGNDRILLRLPGRQPFSPGVQEAFWRASEPIPVLNANLLRPNVVMFGSFSQARNRNILSFRWRPQRYGIHRRS